MRRSRRHWVKLASFLYERHDGLRVHIGGFIRAADRTHLWSVYRLDDLMLPAWKAAKAREPKSRRALLRLADDLWPAPVEEPKHA